MIGSSLIGVPLLAMFFLLWMVLSAFHFLFFCLLCYGLTDAAIVDLHLSAVYDAASSLLEEFQKCKFRNEINTAQ